MDHTRCGGRREHLITYLTPGSHPALHEVEIGSSLSLRMEGKTVQCFCSEGDVSQVIDKCQKYFRK